MIGHIQIKERGSTPRGFAKQRRAMMKSSWKVLGEDYRRRLLPRRFARSGALELGYAARKPRYEARKRRLLGHTDPLVFSRETRNNVLAGTDVRPTSNGVRIPLKGTRKLNRNNPRSNIKMHEEIRRVSRREAIGLARVYDRDLDGQLKANQTSQSKAIP